MKRVLGGVVLMLVLAGCAPWISIHKVKPGMTKSEVLQVLGKPVNASGFENEEYLWYVPVNKLWQKYYVHLVDGRVEAYGPVTAKSGQP